MTPTIAKEEQEAILSSPEETQEDATTFIGIGGDEIVIDLSAEAVAEGADILEDVAFDTLKNNNSKKRSFDASHKKKQRSSNNNNNKKKKQNSYDSSILNESTTIEDLQTIDASAYLAWVNSQAGALPSVFVADEQQNDNNSSVISAIKNESSKDACHQEDPIDGSAATVQILLSKRMDILPPPTIHHIPPTSCNASIFHINSSESSTEDDVADASEDTDGTNNTNNWLNTTISSFSKLRSYLETQDALRKQTTSNNNHNNVDDDDDNPHSIRKIAVPKMKDRSGWHVFCLGREEAFGNKGGYFEDVPDSDSEHDKSAGANIDDDNDEDEQSSKVNDDIKVKSEDGDASASATNTLTYNEEQVPPSGYTPTTSLLLQLDQVLTRVLFHHHVHYLCEWKFPLSHQRAAWIYALLARMNKPWHRDECCAVRRVLRECCSRRYELSLPTTTSSSGTTTTKKDNNNNSTNEENDKKWEQLAMLNTLIAVTGVYYEQGSKAGGDGMDVLFSVSNTM